MWVERVPAGWTPAPASYPTLSDRAQYLTRRGGAVPTVTMTDAWCKRCQVWKPHREFETGCQYRCPLDVSPTCLECDARRRRQRMAYGTWPVPPIWDIESAAPREWIDRFAAVWIAVEAARIGMPRDGDGIAVPMEIGNLARWIETQIVHVGRRLLSLPLKRTQPKSGHSDQISGTRHWQSRNGLILAPRRFSTRPVWIESRGKALQERDQVARALMEMAA